MALWHMAYGIWHMPELQKSKALWCRGVGVPYVRTIEYRCAEVERYRGTEAQLCRGTEAQRQRLEYAIQYDNVFLFKM
jgi:hypothetical protein